METVYSLSFYIISATMIIFALLGITAKNILHSVLYVLITLFSVGLLILFLGFSYTGAVQISISIVGMSIISVFAIMLYKKSEKTYDSFKNTIRVFIICLSLFILIFTFIEMLKGGYLSEIFENTYFTAKIDTKEFAEQIFLNYGAAFVFSSLAFLASILGFGVFLSEKGIKGEKE